MFKNKSHKILSPLFIIFSICLLYFGNFKFFLIYAIVVSLHELAHYFVSKKLGYKLNKLYIMPYGICLNYNENAFGGNDEIYIALAGPLFNYLICALCVALWWLFPETYYVLDYFCFCNLTLATFNLLPCFPLDGGRVFLALFSKKFDREKVFKFSMLLNYIISFLLLIAFIISLFNDVNYTYITLAIFLFTGSVEPNKYSSYNYLSLGVNRESLLKNGTSIKTLAISGKTPLYKIMAKFSKYKFNIVYIILSSGAVKVYSEINIQRLAIKYSPAFSIEEIFAISSAQG